MGIYIHLDILAHKIDPEAWAEAYDDTLRLLRAYPAGLMGLDIRTVDGMEVIMYTRDIERDRDDPVQRCWCVVGDFETLQTAEDHVMYRDLNAYVHRHLGQAAGDTEPPEDILLAQFHHHGGGKGMAQSREQLPVSVFENKTQGLSYHIPLLAAALVIETRFPQYAMVSDGITPRQVDEARAWAEEVLGIPLASPLRMDRYRLKARLEACLGEDERDAAFERLYIDSSRKGIFNTLFETSWGRSDDTLKDLPRITSPDRLDVKQGLALDALARKFSRARQEKRDEPTTSPLFTRGETTKDRRRVIRLLVERSLRLSEDAWKWIRVEESPSVLEFMTFLATLPLDLSMDDWNVQRGLFENKTLCYDVVAKTSDVPSTRSAP